MSIFIKDLEEQKRNLDRQVRRGRLCRLLTLGLYKNEEKIRKALATYDKANDHAQQYMKLMTEADKVASEVLQYNMINDVRVSKLTFADLTRTQLATYPIDWDRLRVEILERDGYACQESGINCVGPLQIHHILPLSKGGSNAADNLITLCHYHHSEKHPHMMERYHGNIWS